MEHRDWVNLVIFKLGWVVAVMGREDWLAVQLVLVAASTWVVRPSWPVVATLVSVALLGIFRDAALVVSNVLDMGGSYMPTWLALLWVQFALVLQRGMHWLAGLAEVVQVPVGMVTGGLAYAAAVALGAGTVGGGLGGATGAWAAITLTWGALLWLQLKLFARVGEQRVVSQ